MLQIIINSWAFASPFAVMAAYHLGRAHGIEKTLRRFRQ